MTRTLNTAHDEFLSLMHKIVFCVDRRADQALADSGANFAQFLILLIVARFPGLSQSDIAKHLNLTPGTVSRTVDRLVKDNLLTRTVNPENRRLHTVRHTKLGEKRFENMYGILHENFKGIIESKVSSTELNTVSRILTKILFAFDPSCRVHESKTNTVTK